MAEPLSQREIDDGRKSSEQIRAAINRIDCVISSGRKTSVDRGFEGWARALPRYSSRTPFSVSRYTWPIYRISSSCHFPPPAFTLPLSPGRLPSTPSARNPTIPVGSQSQNTSRIRNEDSGASEGGDLQDAQADQQDRGGPQVWIGTANT